MQLLTSRKIKGGGRSVVARVLAFGVAFTVLGASIAIAGSVLVLHLNIQPVLTGSMRPAFGPGTAIITEPVPVRQLRPGMIIVFVPPGDHVQYAHRITSVTGRASDPVITTKGDANRSADPWHARFGRAATVPRVVGTLPWIGNLMARVTSIRLGLILAGGLIVAVFGSLWILHPRRRDVLVPRRSPSKPIHAN